VTSNGHAPPSQYCERRREGVKYSIIIKEAGGILTSSIFKQEYFNFGILKPEKRQYQFI